MTEHRKRLRPRLPFFKDETVFGTHVTLRASLFALIVSLVVGAVVIAAAVWWAVSKVQDLDGLIAQRHTDNIAVQQREADIQARDKQESFDQVANLACTVAGAYPPGVSALIDTLRTQYDCPPYGTPVAPTNATTPPRPKPTPTRSVTPSPSPSSTSVHSPVDTGGSAIPGPSATPTVSVTPTPLLNVPDATCRLLGVLC